MAPEKFRKQHKDPDDAHSMAGTLMIKKNFLTAIQNSVQDTAQVVKDASTKTDELINTIAEGIKWWKNTQDEIASKEDKDKDKATDNTTKNEALLNEIREEVIKIKGDVRESEKDKVSDESNETKNEIKRISSKLEEVISENADLRHDITQLKDKITNLTKNIGALRAGQATTDIQLKKTQDLSHLLPPSQSKPTYSQVTGNSNPWREQGRPRRSVQPQPFDDLDEIQLQSTLGNYNSAEAQCHRRRQFQPKEQLSQSIIESTKEAVKEREAKTKEDPPRNQPQNIADQEDNDITRDHIIAETFQSNKLIIGFRPITLSSVEDLTKKMEEKGIFDQTHDREYRQTKSMQTATHMFMKNQLKMSASDRRSVKIQEIFFSTNLKPSTLYVQCASFEDTALIYKHAPNLPQNSPTGPQLDYFTPPQFHKRRQEIETLAWQIRIKSEGRIQTNIRQGRLDYILRQRPKGSKTPWSEIPPTQIPESISKFVILKKPVSRYEIKDAEEGEAVIFSEMNAIIEREKSEKGNEKKRRKLCPDTPTTFNLYASLQDLPNEDTDEEDEDEPVLEMETNEQPQESKAEEEDNEKENECPISNTQYHG